jgi:phosphoribosylanthranilate isomerase
MKIKVCGMREPDNIEAVAALPIDYMGFIFYKKSPRYVHEYLDFNYDANIERIGVFVNEKIEKIFDTIDEYDLHGVQLHGQEPPQYLDDLRLLMPFDCTIIKAFAVDETFDFTTTSSYEGVADYFLFDTKSPNHGGTGIKFDWSILEKYTGETPFFLAGGIAPDDINLIKSLNIKQLYALDLNSKFETKPAVKDVGLLKNFISAL